MGARRGAANIEAFNDEREKRVLPLVVLELSRCKKDRLIFKSPGHLAAYLSRTIDVHRTTLTRNLKYRTLLLSHISSQPGAAGIVTNAGSNSEVLKAQLASTQLEAGNLRSELRRTTTRINHSLKSMSTGSRTDETGADVGNLSMLLCLVLSRLSDTMKIDFNSRSILDLAARPSDRLVAGADRAASFVSWIERNGDLPIVAALRGKPS